MACVLLTLNLWLTGAGPEDDDLRQALDRARVTPELLTVSDNAIGLTLDGASRPGPLAGRMRAAPLDASTLAVEIQNALIRDSTRSPAEVLALLTQLARSPVRRGLLGDPSTAYLPAIERQDPLVAALGRIGAVAPTAAQLEGVPRSVRQAAALLLLAIRDVQPMLERAQRSVSDDQWWTAFEREQRRPLSDPNSASRGVDATFETRRKRALTEFDALAVAAAAQDLLFATQRAAALLRDDAELAEASFSVSLETPFGLVILADSRADTHDTTDPVAILLDVGGDETYTQAGANHGRLHPVSIAIDLGGDDLYSANDVNLGSFGAGVMGVGILVDIGGVDIYEASRCAQGCGKFGVGVLLDLGDRGDAYKATLESQGFAEAGFALLVDSGGDDRYDAFLLSQGAAAAGGAAALVDVSGDDVYVASGHPVLFPSAQDPNLNMSLCQGAAAGVRGDYADGVSVEGGVGVLVDAAGDDQYRCSVFGQGAGYWLGVGLLMDASGDDVYEGEWYVQGAGAHGGVGLRRDGAGNDRTIARRSMAMGAGHDLALGLCIDCGGNDAYEAATLSLGASNASGVGLFVDHAGDDQYRAPLADCLGWARDATGLRAALHAAGVFVDLGGRDAYAASSSEAEHARAADGTTWRQGAGRQRGVGIDWRPAESAAASAAEDSLPTTTAPANR